MDNKQLALGLSLSEKIESLEKSICRLKKYKEEIDYFNISISDQHGFLSLIEGEIKTEVIIAVINRYETQLEKLKEEFKNL